MSASDAADKARFRRALDSRRRNLDAATVAARSLEACRRLRALPEWTGARTVACYAALGGEIDPAVLDAEGRRLVFPRVTPGGRVLDFHEVGNPAELIRGRYGVREPYPDPGSRIALSEIDLFLVPGVAFDPSGRRLGRGGGHYDATLAAAGPGALRVGLAHDWQIVSALPFDPWDEHVDLLVTDEKVLRIGRRSATKTS